MTPNPQQQGKRFKNIATLAACAADGKKGMEIRLLHIRPLSSIADYLLIISATSPAHMGAIEEEVRIRLKNNGESLSHRDGRQSDVWRVLDYGGLLVHIMHPKAREFYALDKLFHGARSVAWKAAPAAKKKALKKKRPVPAKKTVRRRARA